MYHNAQPSILKETYYICSQLNLRVVIKDLYDHHNSWRNFFLFNFTHIKYFNFFALLINEILLRFRACGKIYYTHYPIFNLSINTHTNSNHSKKKCKLNFFFVVPHVKVRFYVRDDLMKIKVLKLKETIISVIISMTHSVALFLTFATSSHSSLLFHFAKLLVPLIICFLNIIILHIFVFNLLCWFIYDEMGCLV